MLGVLILPAALLDIKDAAHWYNSKQTHLGKEFTFKVRQKIRLIMKSPDIYMIRYEDVHTAVVDVFPFMIHFAVDLEKNVVVVFAVLHTSQSPDSWRKER
jgi:plasmid stabilization system protein ParE